MFLANCPQCHSPGLVGSGRILEFERTADGAHLIWYRCPSGHVSVEQLDRVRTTPSVHAAAGVGR